MTSESHAWERPDGTLVVREETLETAMIVRDGDAPSDAVPLHPVAEATEDERRWMGEFIEALATTKVVERGAAWTPLSLAEGRHVAQIARQYVPRAAAPVAGEDAASPDEEELRGLDQSAAMDAWTLMSHVGDAINHRSPKTPVVAWVDGNAREVIGAEYDEDVEVLFIKTRREVGWGDRLTVPAFIATYVPEDDDGVGFLVEYIGGPNDRWHRWAVRGSESAAAEVVRTLLPRVHAVRVHRGECGGSEPGSERPAVAPDTQSAAPTRDALVAAFKRAEVVPLPMLGAAHFAEPQYGFPNTGEAKRMADVALGVLRGGGADGGDDDEGLLRSLAAAVAASDEAPDMGLAWLTDYTHAETEDAWTAGTCVLGKCVDRRYPDAVCEHETDDYRREVVRLRRVVQRIGATNITHLSRQYRAICKRYGKASEEIARLRGENARLRTEEREEVTKLRTKLTAARPNFGHIARLAMAAGVSPDSEDVVGAIEAAIRAGRPGHEDLFAAAAGYWQRRHGAVAGRVRAAVKALSGGGEHYLMEPGLESRPEPPVGTTFTNHETGEIAWQRQDDGWHCTRADCWSCPAGWDEVCDWGGGVDGLVRHLPVVRVGTGGGES